MADVKILQDLSPDQHRLIVDRIQASETFEYVPLNARAFYGNGSIEVKDPKEDHPKGSHFYYPVGSIGPTWVQLLYTDIKFPKDYHGMIRDLLG